MVRQLWDELMATEIMLVSISRSGDIANFFIRLIMPVIMLVVMLEIMVMIMLKKMLVSSSQVAYSGGRRLRR